MKNCDNASNIKNINQMTHVYHKEIEGLHFDKSTLLFFIENSLAIYRV